MRTRYPGDHDLYIAWLVTARVRDMARNGRAIRKPVPIGASWVQMHAEAERQGVQLVQAELGWWFAEPIAATKADIEALRSQPVRVAL